jgi:predicted Fe-Mo cluster-binding NifX family protein
MSEHAIKVAVASQQGVAVDEHFGHAKRFWIYEVTTDGCEFLEQREVDHYCHGNTSNKRAMTGILQTISDCQAVLVAKIGDGPADKLAAIGVEAVNDYPWSPVEEALLAYVRERGE